MRLEEVGKRTCDQGDRACRAFPLKCWMALAWRLSGGRVVIGCPVSSVDQFATETYWRKNLLRRNIPRPTRALPIRLTVDGSGTGTLTNP